MRTTFLFFSFCLMLCFGAVSCRSAADADADAETVVMSEVMEIADCVLDAPCTLVTADMLGTLPEKVRDEAKKYVGKPGFVVVASSLRPRYFRLIRRQECLLLGSVEKRSAQKIVYLSVVSGLGEAAGAIRNIRIENPDSPEPWTLGVFMNRYPELAARIAGLSSDDGRLDSLRNASRELLSRGSTRVMLERHSRTNDPAALASAVQAEQEQIRVLEEMLNSK